MIFQVFKGDLGNALPGELEGVFLAETAGRFGEMGQLLEEAAEVVGNVIDGAGDTNAVVCNELLTRDRRGEDGEGRGHIFERLEGGNDHIVALNFVEGDAYIGIGVDGCELSVGDPAFEDDVVSGGLHQSSFPGTFPDHDEVDVRKFTGKFDDTAGAVPRGVGADVDDARAGRWRGTFDVKETGSDTILDFDDMACANIAGEFSYAAADGKGAG